MILYEGYYGSAPLGNEETIQHYGVMGMKWGQRKYQNPDGTLTAAGKRHEAKTGERGYQYHSFTTKHFDKKSAKALRKAARATGAKKRKMLTKAAKFKKYADRSRELDKREQQYAKQHSAKGNIAARILTGGAVGGKAYQQTLSMLGGQNQKKRITKEKVGAALMGAYGGRLGSTLLKQAYVRDNNLHNQLNAYAKQTDKVATRKKKRR